MTMLARYIEGLVAGDQAAAARNAAVIQAVLDTVPPGAAVVLPPANASSPLHVDATLELPPERALVGAGRGHTVLKAADGANLDAVAASAGWSAGGDAGPIDAPMTVRGVSFDGNAANQAGGAGHGLVLATFWASVADVGVSNCGGVGVLVTSATRDGETAGNAVENHLRRVWVRDTGSHGIHVQDPTPGAPSTTDGWLVDCVVSGPGGDGIRLDVGAGWHLRGNHVYGGAAPVGGHGIHVLRPFQTVIQGNYIEPWDGGGEAGYWAAIACGDSWQSYASGPVTIVGNTAFLTGEETFSTSSGSRVFGIVVYAGNGAEGDVAITGNNLSGVSHPNGSAGIEVGCQGATATIRGTIAGNHCTGWDTPIVVAANGGAASIDGAG